MVKLTLKMSFFKQTNLQILLTFCLFVTFFPSNINSKNYYLYVKPCFSCDWLEYPNSFRLREQCENARSGIFIEGMTRCVKVEN